jgi:hypothetical protein
MSSERRKQSSRANGAKSHGPTTPEGKNRSARNALQHGMTAACLLLDHEHEEHFEILMQNHIRRFQPAEGVELGLIEEMCAAYWRLHRVWAFEKLTLNHQMSVETGSADSVSMAKAMDTLAAQPGTALMQRYETRMQNMYARAIRTFKLLRTIPFPDDYDDSPMPVKPPKSELPNEPSPETEHKPETPQPFDSMVLSAAAKPGGSRASGVSPHPVDAAQQPAAPAIPPQRPKQSGAVV